MKFQDGFVDLVAEYDRQADQSWNNGLGFENYAGSPYSDSQSFYWKIRSLRFLVVEKMERKFTGKVIKLTEVARLDPVEVKMRNECFAVLEAFVSSNHRSSLRKEDEHLCLSGLLGWDATCLDGIPTEQRMKTLLSTRAVLPQGLLFIAGPRMLDKGWRWALQNFGSTGSEQLTAHLARRDATPAKLCAKGLVVQYPGFIFPNSERPINLDDFFVDLPLFEDHQPMICRVRRHVVTNDENISGSFSETPASIAPLGLFFYSPNNVLAANVPMGAIIVEMDEENEEDASSELEGALVCSYNQLASIEVLGYKDVISPVYPEVLITTDVLAVPKEAFGMKRWCVG